MYKYFSATAFLFLLAACQNKPKEDLKEFITDKVWIDTRHEGQYYYSSEDGKQYLWMPAVRDGKLRPAKGTPETHKYNPNPEGWMPLANFKIIGDTLVRQSEDDLEGKDIFKIPLERRKDTTIGIIDYYVVKAYPGAINTTWLSRK